MLRVLEEQRFEPVGSNTPIKVDVRIISATNKRLEDLIENGNFRHDLFYRLNVIPVHLPPLRQRVDDIPILANHFLGLYSRRMEKSVRGFSPAVIQTFLEHPWRGNVRELEKTVKLMVVLAETGDVLDMDLLPQEMREAEPNGTEKLNGKSLRSNISQLERRMIAEALDRCRWNKARAARELGLSYPTLLSKIRTLEIERRKRF